MAIDKIKIIEAKFKRDGKGLNKTFLVNSMKGDNLSCFVMINRNIIYSSGEAPIIFHYEGDDQWYIISDKRIIEKNGGEVLQIDFRDILSVNSLLAYQKDIIEEKRRGLDYILFSFKSGDTHKLNVEKESFSVIDGVLTYLIDKADNAPKP